MIPSSLSATAIQVSSACLSRFKAEKVDRAETIGNTAASLGSSVHGALELFVVKCYIEKSMEPSLQLLIDFFRMSYMQQMGTAEEDSEDFVDGLKMMEDWWNRNEAINYFENNTVLTAEVKENFPIPTTAGDIPFNYILDRFDQIEETVFKVVDYKSNRLPVQPADLKNKIQPRAYSLAMRMKHPEATKIWVEFDMLRHDGPVGTVFTREDDVATYKFLKREAQRIVDTPDDRVAETLNADCRYCVRKQACGALKSNISAGGIFSVGGAEQAVDLRAQLEWQRLGINSAIDELDKIILADARELDQLEFISADNIMEIASRRTRAIDPGRVEAVIGTALFSKYCKTSITLAVVDKLIRGRELTPAQKAQLKGMIFYTNGEAKVKIKPKSPIDEE